MTPYPRPTLRSLILRAGLMRALAFVKAPWLDKAKTADKSKERILARIDKSV